MMRNEQEIRKMMDDRFSSAFYTKEDQYEYGWFMALRWVL